jgi:hypothetical protein
MVAKLRQASLREDLLSEEQLDVDSDSGSVDTTQPQPISQSGHDTLKRKFLNCLAECAANKKGGQSVACSAMKEAEESVTIWITRNEGFQEHGKSIFDRVAGCLSKLSCGGGMLSEIQGLRRRNSIKIHLETKPQPVENPFWDLMLDYQCERLEGTFIPNLRLSFKECVGLFNVQIQDDFDSTLLGLSSLRILVFDVTWSGQKLVDKHKALVTKASTYGVQRVYRSCSKRHHMLQRKLESYGKAFTF